MDHARRLAVFRLRLDQMRLDAYWLADSANVRYLCGFPGEDSGLLVTPSRSILVTDSRYIEQAEREARADQVLSRHASMAQTVALLCKGLGIRRLGFTPDNLTHAAYLALAAEAKDVALKTCSPGIAETLRLRKDAEEVEAIRAALRVAQEAFRACWPQVEPGMTERQLAARLEYEMRSRGADAASFPIICAVDGNASVPHAVPGDAAVGPHSSVLFDWGARLTGYYCDLTRTVRRDRIPPDLHDIIQIVLAAQAAVLEKLKPGNRCCEADAAGRAVICKAGYGNCFGHSVGHGLGLAVHEEPRLAPGVEMVLVPGMVVTVEPGIYVPGRIGVRIEDMALVTADGPEVLSSLPREPEELNDL